MLLFTYQILVAFFVEIHPSKRKYKSPVMLRLNNSVDLKSEKCPLRKMSPRKKPLKEVESGKPKYFIQCVYIIVVV